MAQKPDAAGDPSFEAALCRLAEIVDQLESGELPLEGALAAFEEGVALSRRCAAELEAAERRIEVLLREGGVARIVPFEPEGEDEA
jgi:exodeoxyribonuclease VII small subunit